MSRSRAFTVMEVMVAIALFAVAAVILGGSYMNVLNAYAAVERKGDYDQDVKFARAALLAEADRDTVEKGGDFETTEGRRVVWKAVLEPTEMPDLFTVAFECEINSTQMKEPVVLHETFRVLRPSWSKSDERDVLRGKVRERIEKITPQQTVTR